MIAGSVGGLTRVAGTCLAGACLAVGSLGVSAAGLAGQGGAVGGLASACAGSESALVGPCSEAAFAARALRAGAGLLAAQGSGLPGNSSTLGRRLRTVPRVAFSLRAGGARLRSPDVMHGGFPVPESSSFGWTTQLHGQLGLFHGFSLLPTVGGFLSLDLAADAGILYLPEDNGFRDDVGFWGVGARLGILRESFTMPGVSVSAAYRSLGEIEVGPVFGPTVDPGPSANLVVDPSVTSIRAVAGKDLLALGLMAGVGWDRYSGDHSVTARALTDSRGLVTGQASGDEVDSRLLYFGAVSLTFLVLQVSGEAGWAQGLEEGAEKLRVLRGLRGDPSVSDPFDPAESTFFANVALRITL